MDGFSAWLAAAGHTVLQILPIVDPAACQESAYFAQSAFSIDTLFIALDQVEDFQAAGGKARVLGPDGEAALERARAAPSVDHATVRGLKSRALEAAFARFFETEWKGRSARAAAFQDFRERHRAWLEDYALFRALKERAMQRAWWDWEPGLKDREPAALARARAELEPRVLFFDYCQWQAEEQWDATRRAVAARGVALKGDLPFVCAADSADVWTRREEFRLDWSLGAPPDAFNAEGQDWDLPVYRWDVMERSGFAWLRERGRRASELYDLYRIDHVIGYYRMWVKPRDGSKARFVPPDEGDQVRLAEKLLGALAGAGDAALIAEDLGVVPDFARASLTRLGIPGYRVLRWEADWDHHAHRNRFRDPARYPALSVATPGTHDNEPLAAWWEALPAHERRAVLEMPALAPLARKLGDGAATCPFTPEVHEALLEALEASGSDLVILPIQDVFGTRERINIPATVGAHNWSYRVPWTVEDLVRADPGRSRAAALSALAARSARTLART
jgi:4-alpha-glucanotransferase